MGRAGSEKVAQGRRAFCLGDQGAEEEEAGAKLSQNTVTPLLSHQQTVLAQRWAHKEQTDGLDQDGMAQNEWTMSQ